MTVRACDKCDATVFEDEAGCYFCGSTDATDTGMSSLAETALEFTRRGHSIKESLRIVMREYARVMVRETIKAILTERLKKDDDDA